MTEESKRLVTELRSETCRCGREKRIGETFCRGCYYSLPVPMRKALYRRIGQGYEKAYRDAVAVLGPSEKGQA